MAVESRLPFAQLFWGNTQKHAVNNYEQRYRFGGFIIGDDEELAIIRHAIDAIGTAYQAEATVASQTCLHLIQQDTRAVIALKITNEGTGDSILDDSGAKLTAAGMFSNGSARELKDNMKVVDKNWINQVLGDLKIYQFQYKKTPGINYVSPEAGEFFAATGLGDSKTIAPSSIASIALKGVQMAMQKVRMLEGEIAKLKAKLTPPDDPPPAETQTEPTDEDEPGGMTDHSSEGEPSEELKDGDAITV